MMPLSFPVLKPEFGRMKAAPNRERKLSPGPNPQIGTSDWRAVMDSTRGPAKQEGHVYGSPIGVLDGADELRFWNSVDKSDECWKWTGQTRRWYGTFSLRGRQLAAHRVAWVISHGQEPGSEVLDHICRNTRCVRPDHLEPVTQAENCARGENGYALRDLCRAGLHDITSPDAVRVGSHGKQCAECYREAQRRYARGNSRKWTCDQCGRSLSARNASRHRATHREAGSWVPVEKGAEQ